MKKLSSFIAGVMTTVLLLALFVPSFAASTLQTIEVVTNGVNISIDGNIISKIGEGYVREGTESEICSSISFQGTTFVPIRRVSEILGINVDYDNNTKTVLLTTNNYELGKDTDAVTINKATEEEIESAIRKNSTTIKNIGNYDDYKSIWTVVYDFQMLDGTLKNVAIFNQGLTREEFIELWNDIPLKDKVTYSQKFVADLQKSLFNGKDLTLLFGWADGFLGTTTCYADGTTTSDFNQNPFN